MVCGACTIILDPDNLPPQTDARPLDARSIDADPSQLAIDRVEPDTIFEGIGSGGGRPALLVLYGRSLVGSATVTAELIGPGTGLATLVDHAATVDGTQAAITVRIPVMADLARGVPRTLRLTVTQGGASDSVDVTVTGLAELTLPGPITDPQYSRITVGGPVHLMGSDPVVLNAVADIEISAKLDGNAAGQTPGPFGCAGGTGGAPGGCTPGGGHAGTGALGGGGGGGFGAPGTGGGGGTTSGGPGETTGGETLVPIVGGANVAGNHGNGGGGGAGGATLGGKGGGGGGVLYLTAGGDVRVLAGGALEAKGGDGTGGTGGGGGGSGGAILVRAGGTLTAPAGRLSAAGGGVGSGNGGVGGLGRIRVDGAAGDVAAIAYAPMAWRGPAWRLDARTLIDTPATEATVVLLGQPGRAFGLRVNDHALAASATPGIDGSVTVGDLPLLVGKNQLCAVVDPNVLMPESLSCIDVFYTGR